MLEHDLFSLCRKGEEKPTFLTRDIRKIWKLQTSQSHLCVWKDHGAGLLYISFLVEMCFPWKSAYQLTVIFQEYPESLPSIKRYPHWSKIQHSSSLSHTLIDLTLNN